MPVPGSRCFNPRPPLLAGESQISGIKRRPELVSIHARHCWRANHAKQRAFVAEYLFQSAPAIAGGRILPFGGRGASGWCFNPRPPLLAGESSPARPSRCHRAVSIRARHCWRANLLDLLLAGQHAVVSIRARHCWRANPVPGAPTVPDRRFQSAPAIAGGRIQVLHAVGQPVDRFNPRPPLLAGESHCERVPAEHGFVSIRARHCWRANPCWWLVIRPRYGVSIRARHCWRANPTPDFGGFKFYVVSIRARHCWRANPTACRG